MSLLGSPAENQKAAAAAANAAMPAPLPPGSLKRLETHTPWNESKENEVEVVDLEPRYVGQVQGQEPPQRPSRSRPEQYLAEPQPMQDSFGGMYHPDMPPPYGPMGGMPGMPPWPMPGMWPGMPPWPHPGWYPPMQPGMYPPSMGMMGVPPMGGPPGHGGPQAGAGPASAPAAKAKNRERRRRGNKTKSKEDEDSGGNQQTVDTDEANAARSAELVEVRKQGATKCKLPLAKVLPHIQEFALDQHGSRFLQTKLESADTSQEEKKKVFDAILPEAAKLASDSFAHFVVQKLFEVGTTDQKEALVHELKDDILRLCKESCGCRVIQKAIHHIQRETQLVIAKELEKDVIGCIENPHGNHVIQKCIEQMNPDSVRFIVEKIEKETEKMATHMYGCRVIQRLLEHFSVNDLNVMLERILEKVPDLAADSYGNYVIQHMLDHSKLEDKKKIIMEVTQDVVKFSKLKHASNVVEKCFEVATQGGGDDLENERAALFKCVLGEPGGDCPLYQIMDDKYGNYIVQRMIEFSTSTTYKAALKQCLSNPTVWEKLKTSSEGPHKHVMKAYRDHFGDPE